MNVYQEGLLLLILFVMIVRHFLLVNRVEKLEKIVKDNDGLLAVHHFHHEEN